MLNNNDQQKLTTIIKAKYIDEKGQLKKDSYYWILPEKLTAEVRYMAFVETNQGPQVVHIVAVRQWGYKRTNKFINTTVELHRRDPEELKKGIAVQPKPKNG